MSAIGAAAGVRPDQCPRCGLRYTRATIQRTPEWRAQARRVGWQMWRRYWWMGIHSGIPAAEAMAAIPWRCRCGMLLQRTDRPFEFDGKDLAVVAAGCAVSGVAAVTLPFVLEHPWTMGAPVGLALWWRMAARQCRIAAVPEGPLAGLPT